MLIFLIFFVILFFVMSIYIDWLVDWFIDKYTNSFINLFIYLFIWIDAAGKGGKKGKAGESENVDWGARMADMKRYRTDKALFCFLFYNNLLYFRIFLFICLRISFCFVLSNEVCILSYCIYYTVFYYTVFYYTVFIVQYFIRQYFITGYFLLSHNPWCFCWKINNRAH